MEVVSTSQQNDAPMNASLKMKTASLETKGQAPATAKRPYEAPVLHDWGTLEELTSETRPRAVLVPY